MPEPKKTQSIDGKDSLIAHCCPKCGTAKVRQSVRRGVLEYLVSLVGVYPYECTYYTCLHRFYHRGHKFLAKSGNSGDRSVADYLYDGGGKETTHKQKQIISSDRLIGSGQRRLLSVKPETNGYQADPNDLAEYDFVPLSQLQPRQVLTLTWNDRGQQKNYTIYSQNDNGVAGRVKLGRNPSQCDLLFADRTVSGVNAEIYFDCQLQKFLLSNLRAINPPFLDRQKVVSTTDLHSGVVLYLGRVPIAIEIGFDYAEIEPTLGFDGPTHLFDREEYSA
jgi:hypothetical protein